MTTRNAWYIMIRCWAYIGEEPGCLIDRSVSLGVIRFSLLSGNESALAEVSRLKAAQQRRTK